VRHLYELVVMSCVGVVLRAGHLLVLLLLLLLLRAAYG
jgi:hypothetical protein